MSRQTYFIVGFMAGVVTAGAIIGTVLFIYRP
jgi:hypothetical protein